MNEELKDFLDKKLNTKRPEPPTESLKPEISNLKSMAMSILFALLTSSMYNFSPEPLKTISLIFFFVALALSAWYFGRWLATDK